MKNYDEKGFFKPCSLNLNLSMKLTAILLLVSIFSVEASVYSQKNKVTLDLERVQTRRVLETIESLTDLKFFYNNKNIDAERLVSIRVVDRPVSEVLDIMFEGTAIYYILRKRQVILKLGDIGKLSSKNSGDRSSIIDEETVQQSVSGTVTDANDAPLPGANILEKGTINGVQSDFDGNFSIEVSDENATLVVSYIGFAKKEVPLNGETTLNIVLEESAASLEEVVVIGYGTQRKKDLTGSVAVVKEEDINAYPSTNVMQSLSGRAAGVQILQNNGSPGADVSVRIRGTNSVQGSNEPLYVVDGFPLNGNPAQLLNNSDIESMQILKDASATAIYGSRGANGVVIITTKRGKSGATKVDVELSSSIQTISKKLDLMNAYEYATLYNEGAVNDGVPLRFTDAEIQSFGKEGTDWQDLIFRDAPMSNTSVNISGGNAKTQFSLSGSVFKQDGIIIGSDYNRYSVRTTLNHDISSKLSVSLSSTLTNIQSNRKNSGGGSRGTGLISAILSSPPILKPYNDDGTYTVLGESQYPFIATVMVNPLNFIYEETDVLKANTVLTNAAVSYKPAKDLTIKISGGIENTDDRTDRYTTTKFYNSQGAANVRTTQFRSLLSENTVSYNKYFGKHRIDALAGFTYQNFIETSSEGSGRGFINDISQTHSLQAASTLGIPQSSYVKSTLMSYLGRLNYSYNDKYLATVSSRYDGASKYSEGNKWGYFPSGSLAWRVSEEDFFKNISGISDLKLRAGWGLTGSQAIDAYATLNLLNSAKTVFNDGLYTAYAPSIRLPGDLKWETTETVDIGVDIGLLENRLTVTADYYNKITRDLLNLVQLPSSMGFLTTIQNVGKMQNRGFEIGVDANILNGGFTWDVNANISFNKNKVLKLYGGEDIFGGRVSVTAVQDNVNILREGRPIGQFYGYVEDGYTTEGKIKYKDLNNDGTITNTDKTYIGDPNPDFIYGLNSSMTYKNFGFTFFIQGVQGNDIYNVSSINSTLDYGLGLNMPRDVYLNHWTPTNTTNAKYPQFAENSVSLASDRFVENGSFMRLKNIQLAYNVDDKKLGVSWIRNIQLYVSGQNLLTVTKYSWWDPEVNSSGGPNSIDQGFDVTSYPNSKSVTLGIRAGF
ncbi:TonB-linked outer membrane protein, SusC/RagA family [Pricia antarctica]|uniref:TonB-linked outer membrane protein, SusC/RagA family n=1 Tax=Pricia antarctica TaxID=641691 RepID=A0A1G7HZ45_9FLAO|nr:TonB-dependent receptor [Pricia antarctica]SDF05817.1 TonB-linked outer membrane protein, SusC/RagA family [Pricia antarctica]